MNSLKLYLCILWHDVNYVSYESACYSVAVRGRLHSFHFRAEHTAPLLRIEKKLYDDDDDDERERKKPEIIEWRMLTDDVR